MSARVATIEQLILLLLHTSYQKGECYGCSPVLVVDFGAQYAQLIARRVREANVYSELVPHSMPVDEMLAKDPQAIILSGGPASVFEPGAPRVDKKLFEAGVPVLGICYGFQAMAYALGANVDKAPLANMARPRPSSTSRKACSKAPPPIRTRG